MSDWSDDIKQRASRYAARRGLVLQRQLGYGQDGTIYASSAPSAIKTHIRDASYRRELDCYHRLRDGQVLHVLGHHVPQLIDWDDELLTLEMTIVQPPFLLDFAGAYLDEAPDFPDEVWEEWHEEKSEQFGEHWEEALRILAILRGHYGIHLLDVNPGNITFDENSEE